MPYGWWRFDIGYRDPTEVRMLSLRLIVFWLENDNFSCPQMTLQVIAVLPRGGSTP
jgi:hypothetical protein